ncbi:MAG TPA: formate dehydrogenase accessory sulfurtransferase FdhD [Anaeromyxobacteraceae bacterium]|nr:formate dehydrogenase accessory sulfurtransferase FdhD [Anaeromyxobacteraceae bacterium]
MAQAPEAEGIARREVIRMSGSGEASARTDLVAVEEPLEIRVDGETVAVTMRTPGQDGDLALGFLFAEGIIGGPDDVGSAAHCGHLGEEGYGNVIDVRSAGGHRIDPERVLDSVRWSATTSSCGVCGRRSIDGLLARCTPLPREGSLRAEEIVRALEHLSTAQPIFARTGGLHASALYAAGGKVVASAEDVGRHNAVDKAVGSLLRQRLLGVSRPAGEPPLLLAVSGRASFEIVQKAAAARIPVVASVSAPSSLAVDLASRAGVTLAGFVRGDRFNVYANPWRLEASGAHPAVAPAGRAGGS